MIEEKRTEGNNTFHISKAGEARMRSDVTFSDISRCNIFTAKQVRLKLKSTLKKVNFHELIYGFYFEKRGRKGHYWCKFCHQDTRGGIKTEMVVLSEEDFYEVFEEV